MSHRIGDRQAKTRSELACPECFEEGLEEHPGFATQYTNERDKIINASRCPNDSCSKRRLHPDEVRKQLAPSLLWGESGSFPGLEFLHSISVWPLVVSLVVVIVVGLLIVASVLSGGILSAQAASVQKEDTSLDTRLEPTPVARSLVETRGSWAIYLDEEGYFVTDGSRYLSSIGLVDRPHYFASHVLAIQALESFAPTPPPSNKWALNVEPALDAIGKNPGAGSVVIEPPLTPRLDDETGRDTNPGLGDDDRSPPDESYPPDEPENDGEDDTELATLQGVVFDELGVSVPNATVYLHSNVRTTTTDARGHYEFRNVTPGVHQLYVQLPGNRSFPLATKPINVSVLSDGRLAVPGEPPGAVYLEDPNTGTVAQNRIHLLSKPPEEIRATGNGSEMRVTVRYDNPMNAAGTSIQFVPIRSSGIAKRTISSEESSSKVLIGSGASPSEQSISIKGQLSQRSVTATGTAAGNSRKTIGIEGNVDPKDVFVELHGSAGTAHRKQTASLRHGEGLTIRNGGDLPTSVRVEVAGHHGQGQPRMFTGRVNGSNPTINVGGTSAPNDARLTIHGYHTRQHRSASGTLGSGGANTLSIHGNLPPEAPTIRLTGRPTTRDRSYSGRWNDGDGKNVHLGARVGGNAKPSKAYLELKPRAQEWSKRYERTKSSNKGGKRRIHYRKWQVPYDGWYRFTIDWHLTDDYRGNTYHKKVFELSVRENGGAWELQDSYRKKVVRFNYDKRIKIFRNRFFEAGDTVEFKVYGSRESITTVDANLWLRRTILKVDFNGDTIQTSSGSTRSYSLGAGDRIDLRVKEAYGIERFDYEFGWTEHHYPENVELTLNDQSSRSVLIPGPIKGPSKAYTLPVELGTNVVTAEVGNGALANDLEYSAEWIERAGIEDLRVDTNRDGVVDLAVFGLLEDRVSQSVPLTLGRNDLVFESGNGAAFNYTLAYNESSDTKDLDLSLDGRSILSVDNVFDGQREVTIDHLEPGPHTFSASLGTGLVTLNVSWVDRTATVSPRLTIDDQEVCSNTGPVSSTIRCRLPNGLLASGKNSVEFDTEAGNVEYRFSYVAQAVPETATVFINDHRYRYPDDFGAEGPVPLGYVPDTTLAISHLQVGENDVRILSEPVNGMPTVAVARLTYTADERWTSRPSVTVVNSEGTSRTMRLPAEALSDGTLRERVTMALPGEWFTRGRNTVIVSTPDESSVRAILSGYGLYRQVKAFD